MKSTLRGLVSAGIVATSFGASYAFGEWRDKQNNSYLKNAPVSVQEARSIENTLCDALDIRQRSTIDIIVKIQEPAFQQKYGAMLNEYQTLLKDNTTKENLTSLRNHFQENNMYMILGMISIVTAGTCAAVTANEFLKKEP